jgi:predicted DNA-binding protein (UPF0251 family)
VKPRILETWEINEETLRFNAWQGFDDTIPSFLPGPGDNYERAEIRVQVYAALGQLTPEHRAVIVLKEIEDLQYHEIAEILNVSIGTVMSRLFYARKKLQSVLRPIITPVKFRVAKAGKDGILGLRATKMPTNDSSPPPPSANRYER